MQEDMMRASVKYTQAEFRTAQKRLRQKNELLAIRENRGGTGVQQIQYGMELVEDGVENIRQFHGQCEALLMAMDEICRPVLAKDPDVQAVGEVVRLIDEMIQEMDATYNDFEVLVNGRSLGSAGKARAEASVHARSVQQYWRQQYRKMPGYQQDQKRIQNEKRTRASAEQAALEDEVYAVLDGTGWITVQEIKEQLGDAYTAQRISAALRNLVNRGLVERLEQKRYAYFAVKGTTAPKPEENKDNTAGKQTGKTQTQAEPVEEFDMETEKAELKAKKPKGSPVKVVLVVLAVLIAAAVAAVFFVRQQEQAELEALEKQQAEQMQLVEDAMENVLQAVDQGKTVKLVFSEETKLALKEQEMGYIFSNTVVKEAIANKFAQLYRDGDVDGLLEFLTFLDANYASGLMAEGKAFDICFTDEYITDLTQYIKKNGRFLETNGAHEIYSYRNGEFWLSSFVYIKCDYTLDGDTEEATIILGNSAYRHSHHSQYREDSVGYYLVDDTVELVLEEMTATEKERGNCTRCDGTGKVTKHYGNSWNSKPGYRYGERCGKCNGTGWSD